LNGVNVEEIQVVSKEHILQEILAFLRVDDPVDP
jgi:hypothetical protein